MKFKTTAIFSTETVFEKKIESILPNFQIKDKKVNLASRLPFSMKESKLKKEKKVLRKLNQIELDSIGQVLFIKIKTKNEKIHSLGYSLGTGFLGRKSLKTKNEQIDINISDFNKENENELQENIYKKNNSSKNSVLDEKSEKTKMNVCSFFHEKKYVDDNEFSVDKETLVIESKENIQMSSFGRRGKFLNDFDEIFKKNHYKTKSFNILKYNKKVKSLSNETLKKIEKKESNNDKIIIEEEKENFVLTTLHNFTTEDKIDYNKCLIYFIKSNKSKKDSISKLITNINFYIKSNRKNISLQKIKIFMENSINNIFNKNEDFFGEVFLNKNFLILRKNMIDFWLTNFFEENLKDQFYNEKPKPSIDICVLNLSENLKKKLIENNINGFEMYPQKGNNLKKKVLRPKIKNQKINSFLISFQDNKKTSIRQMEFDKENDICFSKNNHLDYPISYFINKNKSVSLTKVWKRNDNLINFEGSTTNGSSGGPLFDIEGQLLGMNFGYYIFGDDFQIPKTKKKQKIYKDDSLDFLVNYDIDFDCEVKKKENLDIGLNLAISIYHPCLRVFFGIEKFKNFCKNIYKTKKNKLSKNFVKDSFFNKKFKNSSS